MRVLPQTPLDWVLLAVAATTGVIIAVALQDFFLDSRVNNPRIRALQDVGVGLAVVHVGGILLLGSVSPRWAAAGITLSGLLAVGLYVFAARREERQLEAHFGEVCREYRSRVGLLVPSLPAIIRRLR